MEHYKQKWVRLERGQVYLVIVGKSESEFHDMLPRHLERLDHGNLLQLGFYRIEKLRPF